MKKLHVKVIGAGGIGTCLLPNLCRLLSYGSSIYRFDDADVAIIDGDQYEEGNRPHQHFCKLGNKADVTTECLKEDFPNLVLTANPTYIDQGNIGTLISDGDIVFLCVDNHKTRNLVGHFCEKELKNVVLISGGNAFIDGNVQVYVKQDGQDQTSPLDRYHPEIAFPQDRHPGEPVQREGCLKQRLYDPQSLIANNMAAALMLNAFHGWLVESLMVR